MVYTRFGSVVTVLGGNVDKGEVDVKREDGSILKTYTCELKADNGWAEISDAIEAANKAMVGV
jgi:hypothetical protein